MSKKALQIIFIVAAIASFAALLFHLRGIFYPSANTPAWRHAIFVAVNSICIYGILKRPGWFTWFVGLLTLQQLYSHGSYAIEFWQKQHSIYWVSVCVIIFMPTLFVLLLIDRKSKLKDSANPSHS
ncbi:MAG: hypothetical protein ABI685_10805 [Ferruginibacter sp.]